MQQLILFMERYGLVAVFLNVLLAEGGLPLPAYPAIVTAAAVAAGSGYAIPELVGVGVGAAIIADLAWFWAGRRHGNRVLALLCRLSLSPDSCVRQTRDVFGRLGAWSLLFAKFVPGLSSVSVAMAGVTRTPLAQFLALDTIGALLFVGVPVMLGRIFKDAVADILETLADLGRVGALLVASALILYLAGKWVQRHRFIRRLRMDRITVSELREMIDAGETPVILDVRNQETRRRDGIIPGAIAAHPSELDPVIQSYDRNIEIVVYCACPNEASAALAAKHLKRAGFKKIRPLLGGADAWVQSGNALEFATTPIAA
jgi:membrane protein DedA with SNARE-associated domain/rhodanese-related sulfurtransferase